MADNSPIEWTESNVESDHRLHQDQPRLQELLCQPLGCCAFDRWASQNYQRPGPLFSNNLVPKTADVLSGRTLLCSRAATLIGAPSSGTTFVAT